MAKKTNQSNQIEQTKVSDTFLVKFAEGPQKEKEVKMSLGLVQTLFSRFTNQDQIYNLGLDFNMQKDLINEVVDGRDEKGSRLNPEIDYSMYLSIEEGEKLNEWISEHIIDFFTSKLDAQERAIKKMLPALQEVNKTLGKAQTTVKESNLA